MDLLMLMVTEKDLHLDLLMEKLKVILKEKQMETLRDLRLEKQREIPRLKEIDLD